MEKKIYKQQIEFAKEIARSIDNNVPMIENYQYGKEYNYEHWNIMPFCIIKQIDSKHSYKINIAPVNFN
jgi:hypothetical protein